MRLYYHYILWHVTLAILSPATFRMYWQRDLPHFVPDGATVFVTWRLAGTLPAPKPESLATDLTPGTAFARSDRELDRSSSGPRWLKDPSVANIVAAALHYGEAVRRSYELHAWVVMPNHVHVVLTPRGHLAEILRWLKAATANRANQLLQRRGAFWQRESYDHWIRTGDEFRSIMRYVEWNPVTAGLVTLPENWAWSSASTNAGGKTASATCCTREEDDEYEGANDGRPKSAEDGVVMTTVVAGILERDGRILICRRRADQAHPLKWEFPGGKLEAGESPGSALVRELNEELGVQSETGAEIARYEFTYPGKKTIELIFIRVARWSGEIENKIFETIVWERPQALADYDFLEGDAPFLKSFTER